MLGQLRHELFRCSGMLQSKVTKLEEVVEIFDLDVERVALKLLWRRKLSLRKLVYGI